MRPINDARTKFLLVTCTVACNIAQRFSPATATSSDFQLPANTILRVRINTGDSLAFVGTSGTAFIVELQ